MLRVVLAFSLLACDGVDDDCVRASDPATPAFDRKLLAPAAGAYLSVVIDPIEPCGAVNAEGIDDFEAQATESFVAWCVDDWEPPSRFGTDANSGIAFPWVCMDSAAAAGKLPMLRWNPRSTQTDWPQRVIAGGYPLDEDIDPLDVPPEVEDSEYGLQRVIDGAFDADFEAFADDAIAFGGAIVLELCSEFSGFQYTCSGIYNGGATLDGYGDDTKADGPERFVDAWRHIVDLFRARGADNVTWLLHYDSIDPTDLPAELQEWNSMASYWPGDDYVDWIGTSMYGQEDADDPWTPFRTILDDNLPDLRALSDTVPVGIVEFGTHSSGRSPDDSEGMAEWLEDMFTTLEDPAYADVRWINWYQTPQYDLTAEDDALAAFRAGAASDYFATTPTMGP